MSLTVLDNSPKFRTFLVYDFEWVPGTLEMRLCGLYDGNQYRAFKTIGAFLSAALTSENRGKWFYAHAGGLADIQFVLEAIIDRCNAKLARGADGWVNAYGNGFWIEAKFSGSSAIIVHVHQGKNVWHFVDSYWLLRAPLAEIGKSIGLAKTGLYDPDAEGYNEEEAREWYKSVPLSTLIPYNQRDCEILWTAIDRFETFILGMGGQLNMTLASCGMGLFRRVFLKRNIETMHYVNECSRGGYFASRVEVFNRYVDRPGFYFDINSSFPYAMTKACPGEMEKINYRLPESYDENRIFMADVEIEAPDNYFTPTPYRHTGNRVFFPIGRWRSWLTSVDLEMLEREGGRILRVHEVIHFNPFYDLADYALTIYEKRKASSDEFERTVYKLLLNSLYGKFAESALKQTFHYNPTESVLQRLRNPMTGAPMPGCEMLFPGAWLQEKESDVPHMHVPISAHITAIARRTIFDYMSLVSTFHYCDTDGFSTTEMLQTSKDLGDLKLEKYIDEAEFIVPKGYSLTGRDEKGKPLEMYKWKGVSLGKSKQTQKARFKALKKGARVSVYRLSRIKENLRRRRNATPLESLIKKRAKMDSIEKRFMYPDGSTRPWHIDELRENVK